MFRKLRNKFLIINMSITSLLMIVAFSLIYWITYNNIQTDNHNKLNIQGTQSFIRETSQGTVTQVLDTTAITDLNSKSTSSFLSVKVDSNGNLLDRYAGDPSLVNNIQKATQMAWKNRENSSTVSLEGRQWMYSITTPPTMHIVNPNGETQILQENYYIVNLLDITESHETLINLLTTLISIGLIMLVLIFFVSRYFANRAIVPIAEAWARQKQFVADASHELKTPLMIMKANYDVLMANETETIQSQYKWLSYIKTGTDRMAKLVNDMLTLTRMDEENIVLCKKEFNLSHAIRTVTESMDGILNDKGITLLCKIEPNMVIDSDEERINQLITILFDNAVKYTNSSGQIELTLSKTKKHVKFVIKNSGKGIPQADLPKVFDRFYRVDPSRATKTEGHGLGLSIAKSIVHLLGGSIHVTSVENEWTTFTFTLNHLTRITPR
ncbi:MULTISPECIES: HAMP domain-containing sensor histidine kinase [Bacillales]|uniref:sensor histidine kinase n=1 Tax=Bacillales TaxID=1385 RepID=UPI00034A520A|nr:MULTISPECIES: HAMP domain-containing sensor histidine kinase [Bacillales]KMZ44838.1 histidine kinase [Bacillus sp. FJAT-27238]